MLLFAGSAQAQAVDHSKLTRILSHAVDESGAVDYLGIIQHRNLLDEYIVSLRAIDPKGLPSNAEKLAYWINFYNALVIESVIGRWPVKSALNDFKGNAFFEQWKHATPIGDLTLNQIEHDILRKQFEEPRVHFAINCASKGCPQLQQKVFTGENLEGMLEQATAAFVNDPAKNRFDFKNGKAEVSSLFNWYADDFKKAGGVPAFLAHYSQAPEKAQIPKLKLSFMEWDWNLNGK
jgi:hypothetical protein